MLENLDTKQKTKISNGFDNSEEKKMVLID